MLTGINLGEWGCRILDIGWELSELVDNKVGFRHE